LNNLPFSIDELKAYREVGGNSIMDPQPIGTGRDAQALETLSRESGVNIIGCTGYHIPSLYTRDHWIFTAPEEKLEELFEEEITDGMYISGCYAWPRFQTDIRAGAIKGMLTEEGIHGLNGRVKQLLRAAGKAAIKTGTPLMLHTEYGLGVLEAVDFLESMGMDLSRVIICHVDRRENPYSVHEEIAKRGVFLEYDTINILEFRKPEDEVRLFMHMFDKGYENQLLIASDSMASRLKAYGGMFGLDYTITEFLPLLKEAGAGSEAMRKIVRDNPSKALQRFSLG
jgi:phosphotriesterase-related protein